MTKLLCVFVALFAVGAVQATDLFVSGTLYVEGIAYFGFGTAVYPNGNYNGLPGRWGTTSPFDA